MAKQTVCFSLEIKDNTVSAIKNPSISIAEILDSIKEQVLKNNEPKRGKVRDKNGNVIAEWKQTVLFENEPVNTEVV